MKEMMSVKDKELDKIHAEFKKLKQSSDEIKGKND